MKNKVEKFKTNKLKLKENRRKKAGGSKKKREKISDQLK